MCLTGADAPLGVAFDLACVIHRKAAKGRDTCAHACDAQDIGAPGQHQELLLASQACYPSEALAVFGADSPSPRSSLVTNRRSLASPGGDGAAAPCTNAGQPGTAPQQPLSAVTREALARQELQANGALLARSASANSGSSCVSAPGSGGALLRQAQQAGHGQGAAAVPHHAPGVVTVTSAPQLPRAEPGGGAPQAAAASPPRLQPPQLQPPQRPQQPDDDADAEGDIPLGGPAGSSVFFARVPPTVPYEAILALFQQFGTVLNLNLFRPWASAKTSKGCGIVEYDCMAAAVAAMTALHQTYHWTGGETTMVVEWMDPSRHRRERPSGEPGVFAAKSRPASKNRRKCHPMRPGHPMRPHAACSAPLSHLANMGLAAGMLDGACHFNMAGNLNLLPHLATAAQQPCFGGGAGMHPCLLGLGDAGAAAAAAAAAAGPAGLGRLPAAHQLAGAGLLSRGNSVGSALASAPGLGSGALLPSASFDSATLVPCLTGAVGSSQLPAMTSRWGSASSLNMMSSTSSNTLPLLSLCPSPVPQPQGVHASQAQALRQGGLLLPHAAAQPRRLSNLAPSGISYPALPVVSAGLVCAAGGCMGGLGSFDDSALRSCCTPTHHAAPTAHQVFAAQQQLQQGLAPGFGMPASGHSIGSAGSLGALGAGAEDCGGTGSPAYMAAAAAAAAAGAWFSGASDDGGSAASLPSIAAPGGGDVASAFGARYTSGGATLAPVPALFFQQQHAGLVATAAAAAGAPDLNPGALARLIDDRLCGTPVGAALWM